MQILTAGVGAFSDAFQSLTKVSLQTIDRVEMEDLPFINHLSTPHALVLMLASPYDRYMEMCEDVRMAPHTLVVVCTTGSQHLNYRQKLWFLKRFNVVFLENPTTDVVLAQIRNLVAFKNQSEITCLRCGDVVCHLDGRMEIKGQDIHVRGIEFRILECLMRSANHVVTNTHICDFIYGLGAPAQSNVFRVRLCSLREKIELHSDNVKLVNKRQQGYILTDKPALMM